MRYTLTLLAACAVACAQEVTVAEITNSSSNSGGSTPVDTGGTAPSACAEDCSAIDVPQCLISVCNTETQLCEAVHAELGTACDDGAYCTADDACSAGQCVGGPPPCAPPDDECAETFCDEEAGTCSAVLAPNGTACSGSGELCLSDWSCQAGACQGVPKDCSFAQGVDDCNIGTCNPATGACDASPHNEGGMCEDSAEPCLVARTCELGQCVGGKTVNYGEGGCNFYVCDPGSGLLIMDHADPGELCLPVDEDLECNTGICNANGVTCDAVPTPGVACASAADDCSVGACSAAGVCTASPANEAMACDDRNLCTVAETCEAGSCVGTLSAGVEVFFSDSFADDSQGWTATGPYGIGPTRPTPGPYGDPAADHTATMDNGVGQQDFQGSCGASGFHIQSPAVDVSGVAGPVWLSFWRYLNHHPGRAPRIQVFDGTDWVTIWQNPLMSPTITEWAWSPHAFDLTAYKNAALAVRFGHTCDPNADGDGDGWNIDDVVIANQACTP
jgi:hypothetical protein